MKKITRLALLLVVIDQLSKIIIANFLELNQTVTVINNFLYLTYLKNSGAAWNILEGNSLFLIFLGFIAIFFIFYLIKSDKQILPISSLSYSLLLGGIIGNLIDRIYLGSVVDFIYVNLLDFPVFNISDIYIFLGVVIFSFEMLRGGTLEKSNSHKKSKNRQISG